MKKIDCDDLHHACCFLNYSFTNRLGFSRVYLCHKSSTQYNKVSIKSVNYRKG